MVFDVNTAYFDMHGGYDYAKDFFKEAYKMAIKEVGGEQYILSAVMHADEKNVSLSEELERDVYHYHMHVTYIPNTNFQIGTIFGGHSTCYQNIPAHNLSFPNQFIN